MCTSSSKVHGYFHWLNAFWYKHNNIAYHKVMIKIQNSTWNLKFSGAELNFNEIRRILKFISGTKCPANC